MARRVTPEDIQKINEVYYQCKNYVKTAEITGWSAATCHKYVQHDYVPAAQEQKTYNIEIPSIKETAQMLTEDDELTLLTEEEKREVEALWPSLLV